MDFYLSQKSYSISVNAIQLLATKRPLFFKEAATCLARRTMHPPEDTEGNLTKSAIVGIRTHLRSSCLTLLRHILSVTSGCSEILVKALSQCGMEAQAERALDASRKQLNLMQGGRAARTRAQIFYEWDTSADLSRAKKRQRDTDDAEARVRAAKLARGLGSGIQLPTSMSDACELVLLNLKHLPSSRPPVPSSVQRSQHVNLDLVVDAVMSNGAALSIDENHWYDRDGGHAWTIEEGEMDEDGQKELIFLCKTTDEKETTKFAEQSRIAASKAFSRILASTSSNRSEVAANLGQKIAARLAWMLQDTNPDDNADFAPRNPLISSCLEYDLNPPSGSELKTKAAAELSGRVLNEMYVSSLALEEENVPPKKYYEECLDYYVSSVVDANNITTNNEKKRSANLAALALPHQLLTSPSLTAASLTSVASFCDIEEISKKAAKSKQSITESAALHAAKAAAEKRGKIAKLQCNLRSCFNVSLLSFSQPLQHCLFFVMLLFSVIMCVAMQ
jgi:symplekin